MRSYNWHQALNINPLQSIPYFHWRKGKYLTITYINQGCSFERWCLKVANVVCKRSNFTSLTWDINITAKKDIINVILTVISTVFYVTGYFIIRKKRNVNIRTILSKNMITLKSSIVIKRRCKDIHDFFKRQYA